MLENRKGFTLTELVITIVIVGILCIVAIPVYQGYIKQAVISEGKVLLGEIAALQEVYFSRFTQYAGGIDPVSLGVDPRRNKYFRSFEVTVEPDGLSYSAETRNEENTIGIKMTTSRVAPPEIIVGEISTH